MTVAWLVMRRPLYVPRSARGSLAAFCALRIRSLLAGALQLSRYSIASGLALGLDFSLYLLLVAASLNASLAGGVSYAAGLGVHYLLSVSFVFDAGATEKAQARLVSEFVLSGIAGLAITALVIALATDALGLSALAAKIAAAGASFIVVFAIRRMLVFRRAQPLPVERAS
jgi:putative flippase GtrA